MSKKQESPEKLKIHCNSCNHQTNQDVLVRHTETEYFPELINGNQVMFENYIITRILKCGSCGDYSLRKTEVWGEDIPNFTEGKEVLLPKRGTSEIPAPNSFEHVPRKIISIYRETVDAFNNEVYLLCACGIRAILEAICNDKRIREGQTPTGKSKQLEGKIYGLQEADLITKNHSKTLHEHRYLGNAALHQLEKPKRSDLLLAIQIIAHTLNTVYALEIKNKKLQNRKSTKKINKT